MLCVLDTTYECTSYCPRIWQRILVDIELYDYGIGKNPSEVVLESGQRMEKAMSNYVPGLE